MSLLSELLYRLIKARLLFKQPKVYYYLKMIFDKKLVGKMHLYFLIERISLSTNIDLSYQVYIFSLTNLLLLFNIKNLQKLFINTL